ncbi:ABC transporter permease [Acuticoccus sediminis]|uniref:ABC transporter permease n=1 Tax=Acuticoccus sediminis TaxID=2184697 RepID=A0A8B2NWU1_9HYPH|nr:proline/glycine betaine ABC transporter permease [Acuticoccus sediminis]RAI03311.1 ABC transporter permease [Acuticoccus sediminis]
MSDLWLGWPTEILILLIAVVVGVFVDRATANRATAVAAGAGTFIVIQLLGSLSLDTLFFDGDVGRSIRGATNDFIEWLVINYGNVFEAISDPVLKALVWLEHLLRDAPVPVVLFVVGILGYVASHRLTLAVGMAVALWFVGMLGLWEQAMQTVAIMLVSVAIAIIIGIPVGVLNARSDTARSFINPVLDLMQTIPSFVYLIPALMLFGLGNVSAVLATVIYATPPLIRLTDLGIRYVDREVVEASRAFGATRWQMLTGVQIPLAMPSIMQGINQTVMMALAMVVIGSMIGARGVGQTVLVGLQRNDAGQGLIGGIAIVMLAIVFDRISQAAGARAQKHRTVAH